MPPFRNCLKSYHPGCLGKQDDFIDSSDQYVCGERLRIIVPSCFTMRDLLRESALRLCTCYAACPYSVIHYSLVTAEDPRSCPASVKRNTCCSCSRIFLPCKEKTAGCLTFQDICFIIVPASCSMIVNCVPAPQYLHL